MQFPKSPLRSTWRWCAAPLIWLALMPAFGAKDTIVDPYHEYRDEVSRGEYDYDDSQDIPWIENETEVLAMPKAEDLHAVRIDTMPQGLELLIDKSRITVDPKDRVVRAWLWIRSSSGSEYGTFEGFRCETREYKVYAYANPRRDPPVSKAKRPLWKAVPGAQVREFHGELLRDYFCGIRGTRSADEIRDYLSGEFRRELFLSQ